LEKDINILVNVTSFVHVARLLSFSAAARELGVAASVITKRITQLEQSVGLALIARSTRGLTLTAAGERYLPRFVRLLGEFDDVFATRETDQVRLEGHLRVKSPTTITAERLGALFADFQADHPSITLEIVLIDRTINPLEEGFDIALGALPVSYPNVVDVPICPYEYVVCCAPAYLSGKTALRHPNELVDYECLTTSFFGTTWAFQSPRGALSVEVHSRMHSSDSRVLYAAALRGLGVAILPRFLASDALRDARLMTLFPEFSVASFWLKALVPRMKMSRPAVSELVAYVKTRMQVYMPGASD
jgi:DNA-binding transcriptional LysR family regulator